MDPEPPWNPLPSGLHQQETSASNRRLNPDWVYAPAATDYMLAKGNDRTGAKARDWRES